MLSFDKCFVNTKNLQKIKGWYIIEFINTLIINPNYFGLGYKNKQKYVKNNWYRFGYN